MEESTVFFFPYTARGFYGYLVEDTTDRRVKPIIAVSFSILVGFRWLLYVKTQWNLEEVLDDRAGSLIRTELKYRSDWCGAKVSRLYVHLGITTAIFSGIHRVSVVTGAVVHFTMHVFLVVSVSCRFFLILQRDFFLLPWLADSVFF